MIQGVDLTVQLPLIFSLEIVVNLFQQIGKHKLNVNLGENRLMFILLAELVKVFPCDKSDAP